MVCLLEFCLNLFFVSGGSYILLHQEISVDLLTIFTYFNLKMVFVILWFIYVSHNEFVYCSVHLPYSSQHYKALGVWVYIDFLYLYHSSLMLQSVIKWLNKYVNSMEKFFVLYLNAFLLLWPLIVLFICSLIFIVSLIALFFNK